MVFCLYYLIANENQNLHIFARKITIFLDFLGRISSVLRLYAVPASGRLHSCAHTFALQTGSLRNGYAAAPIRRHLLSEKSPGSPGRTAGRKAVKCAL